MISLLFSLMALNSCAAEMYSAQLGQYRINFSVLPTAVNADSFSVKKGLSLEDPCNPRPRFETCEITAGFSGGLMTVQILNTEAKLVHSGVLPLSFSTFSESSNRAFCQNPESLEYALNGQLDPVLITFNYDGKVAQILFQPFLNLNLAVRQSLGSLQIIDNNRFELQEVSQYATGAFWTNLGSDPNQTKHFTFRRKADFDRRISNIDWEAFINRH